MNRFFPSLLAALTFTLGASVALADVAPPDCYVEHCTVDQKTQPGTTCTTCENNFMNASDYCQKQVGADYAYACQAWGGSQWQEVWCKGPPKASGTGGGSGTGGDCTGRGEQICGGACVNTLADNEHCGKCFNVCNENQGEFCNQGECILIMPYGAPMPDPLWV